MSRSAIRLVSFNDYEGAIEDASRAIRYNSRAARAYATRGFAYYCLGKVDEAIQDYNRALELKPKLVSARIYRSTLRFERLGDYEGAIADGEAAIVSEPQNIAAYHLLLITYIDKKDYAAALDVCERALKTLRKREYAYVFRAYVIQKQSGIEHALDDMDTAITLAPQDPMIYMWRGSIFGNAHDYEKALEAYSTVLRLQFKTNAALVFAARGICYAYLGQRDEAMQDFTHGIEVNPFEPLTYNNRASVLAKDGQYASAVEDANRCIQLKPAFKNGYDTRGQTYFLMGDYPAALADFEKAADLKRGDAYSLAGQAATHYAMGDLDAAKALWRRTLEQESKYADIQTFVDKFMPADGFMDAIRKVAAMADD
jgi:tetratricopeptide (TPR) repeat protein